MPSQGPYSPTTVTQEGSGISWSNQDAVKSPGGDYAHASLSGESVSTAVVTTGFGFTIPESATIAGIVAEYDQTSSPQGVQDSACYLVVDDTIRDDGESRVITMWPESFQYEPRADEGQTWGLDLSPEDVNSAGFGCALTAYLMGGAAEARIRHVRLTVYYDL